MSDAVAPRRSFLPVLVGGLVTTALALLGVYALASGKDGTYVMGWYANYVLPVGALLVGLVAASGYGIAAWLGGYRISGTTLWLVAGIQFLAYLAAQYVEYLQLAPGMAFLKFFDFSTRQFAFENDGGGMGSPLGTLGYGVRALEVLGFVGGSVLVPLMLRSRPFCESCGRYMRVKMLGYLPASVPHRHVPKSDAAGQAAYHAEQQAAMDAGLAMQDTLFRSADGGAPTETVVEALRALKTSHPKASSLPARIQMQLVRCPQCQSGHLASSMVTGQGNQIKQTPIATAPVSTEVVRQLA